MFACQHWRTLVCLKLIQPASRHISWVPPSSRSIIPPRAQDSTLSFRVTHGEAAPCPWHTAGITTLSLPVTLALFAVMPLTLVDWGGGSFRGRHCHECWQTDRWQVKPDRQRLTHLNLHAYLSVAQCENVCLHINTAFFFHLMIPTRFEMIPWNNAYIAFWTGGATKSYKRVYVSSIFRNYHNSCTIAKDLSSPSWHPMVLTL